MARNAAIDYNLPVGIFSLGGPVLERWYLEARTRVVPYRTYLPLIAR